MPEQKEQFGFVEPDLRKIEPSPQIRYPDIIDPYFTVMVNIEDTRAATAANYGSFFIAPFSCEVIEVWESHRVLGTDAGAVTLDIEKLTSGQALDGGVSVLGSTFNLKATINTPQRAKASTTAIQRFLKSGDRLALDDTGVLTAVADVVVTVLLRVLQTSLNPTT